MTKDVTGILIAHTAITKIIIAIIKDYKLNAKVDQAIIKDDNRS